MRSEFAKAIKMAQDLDSRILKDPQQRMTISKEFYLGACEAGDQDEAHLALLLRSLATGRGDDMKVPAWFAKAGFASGIFTLLFLMLLIVLSVLGHQVPPGSRGMVNLVFSLGGALSVAFLGGEIAASGKIPYAYATEHPLAFSATGGVATLVVLLFALHYLYG